MEKALKISLSVRECVCVCTSSGLAATVAGQWNLTLPKGVHDDESKLHVGQKWMSNSALMLLCIYSVWTWLATKLASKAKPLHLTTNG